MDDIVRHSPVNVTRQKPQPQPRVVPVSVRIPSRPYRREHERHNLSSILTAVVAVFLAYLAFRTLTTPKESTVRINLEPPIPVAKVTDPLDQFVGAEKEDILATKLHDTIESTKEKGKRLVGEAKDISEDVFENVKEKGEFYFEKAKERGEDILEKAKEKGEDVFEILKEKSEDVYGKGKDMWKETKEKIREVKDQSEDVFERMKEKSEDLLGGAKENILEKLEINKNIAQQKYEGVKEKNDDILKDAKGKFSAGLESTKEKLHEAKEKSSEILGEIKEKVVSASEKAEQLRDKFHGIDRNSDYTTLKPFNPWGISMLGNGCELLHCGKDQLCYSLRNMQLMCTTPDIACSTLSKDLCEKESRCGLNYGRSAGGQDTITFCRAKEAACHSEKPVCGLHPMNGMMYYFNDGCLPINRNIYSLKENGPQFQKSEVCF